MKIKNNDNPIGPGPLARFAQALMRLCSVLPEEAKSELVVGIATNRGFLTAIRAKRTLDELGIAPLVYIGTAGEPKGGFLKAIGADIFFDDKLGNVEDAVKSGVFGCWVPFVKS